MATKNKAGKRRKPPRYLPQKIWDEIRARYEAGTGPAEIRDRYGVPVGTLFTRRNKEKWAKRGSKPPCQDVPSICDNSIQKDTPGEPLPSLTRADTAALKHLAVAQTAWGQLQSALEDVHINVKDKSRLGRALADLISGLERLVKLERLVLEVDAGKGSRQVVIIVPQKDSKGGWQDKALAASWESAD